MTEHLTDDNPRLLHPVPDAMRVLGIGRSTLYELIASGEIQTVKIGRRTLIAHDELERYVASLPREKAEPKKPVGPPARKVKVTVNQDAIKDLLRKTERIAFRPWGDHSPAAIRAQTALAEAIYEYQRALATTLRPPWNGTSADQRKPYYDLAHDLGKETP